MVSVIEGSPSPAMSLTTFTGIRLDSSCVIAEWRSACMWVSVGRPALTSSGFQTRLRKLQTFIGVLLLVQKTCSPVRGCRLSASTVSLGSEYGGWRWSWESLGGP
jgi:hypothetical protein